MEIQSGDIVKLTLSEASWMTEPIYVNPDGSLDRPMSDMQTRIEHARIDVVRPALLRHDVAGFHTFDKDENGNEKHIVEVTLSPTELLGILGMAECYYRDHYNATMEGDGTRKATSITRGSSFEENLKAIQVISGVTAAIRKAQDEGQLPKSNS